MLKIKFDDTINCNLTQAFARKLWDMGFRPPITGDVLGYDRDYYTLETTVYFNPSRRDLIFKEFIL